MFADGTARIPLRLSNELTKCDFSITFCSFRECFFLSLRTTDEKVFSFDFSWMMPLIIKAIDAEKKFAKTFSLKCFLSIQLSAYSTNSLTTVSVGKSSLDSHTHFRQPGMELGNYAIQIFYILKTF